MLASVLSLVSDFIIKGYSTMKAKLITILNKCIYNKPITDYQAIKELINSINNDNVKDLNITFNDTNIYLSMFNNDYQLISISFTDSNKLLFCLPTEVSKTYVIENDDYNTQYNDIAKEFGI